MDSVSHVIPLPPAEFIRSIGGGDFRHASDDLFNLVTKHGQLERTHSVLDLGSGCGRLAIPLTSYLNRDALYSGLDIVEPMVDWCRTEITSRFGNFKFYHADLHNTDYRHKGSRAAEFVFPFADASFDYIVATSLFTHLVPDSARQYLRESARVLKPNGRMLATFFVLLPDQPDETMQFKFPYPHGDALVADAANPEAALCYPFNNAVRLFAGAGLSLDTLSFGAWAGHHGWSYQDVIVATRA